MQPKSPQYWKLLRQIRQPFLSEQPVTRDYWKGPEVLAAYDESFGQRIGWKWLAVLSEISELNWQPEPGLTILDWGCGTGVAARACAAHFQETVSTAAFFDRSSVAVNHATTQLRDQSPNVTVQSLVDWRASKQTTLLLASHVVTELDKQGLKALKEDADNCQHLLIVEPGTKSTATKLSRLRDEWLAEGWEVIAPCTHKKKCPAVLSEKHWCHSFATPPREVFHSAYWRAFATELQIDLRSLPYSYLLLSKVAHKTPSSAGRARLLGRPQLKKTHGICMLCSADGLEKKQLNSRKNPNQFSAITNGELWV